jgi:hypothetical protein
VARHEFERAFHVLRDLRVEDVVLGLPWVDDEQASLQLGTTRGFTLMDVTTIEVRTKERRPEFLLVSYGWVQMLMRKTSRIRQRNAELYVINVTPPSEEFNTREEVNAKQRQHFRTLL